MARTTSSSLAIRDVVQEFRSWDELAEFLRSAESVVCISRHLLTLAGRNRWSSAAVSVIYNELADRGLCLNRGVRDGDWVRIMPADGLLAAVHRAIANPSPSGESLLASLGIELDEASDDLAHPLSAAAYHLDDTRPRIGALGDRLDQDFEGGVWIEFVHDDEMTFRTEYVGSIVTFPTTVDDYLTTASNVTGARSCFRRVRDWFNESDGWNIDLVYWAIVEQGLMSWFPDPQSGVVAIRRDRQHPSMVTFRRRGAIDFLACPENLQGDERLRRTRTGRWELLPTDDEELPRRLMEESVTAYWALD